MTKVTEALDRIARECSITAPSSWINTTKLEHVELRDDFLSETVANILDRVDLPSPIGKQTTITGTGVESYSLPSNFRRLARDELAVYETTTLRRAAIPVSTDGAWTHLNSIGTAGTNRFYAIEGYEGAHTIKFEQDLATGSSVTVSYISNVWIVDSGGSEATEFDDVDDILALPRRVIETGTIYRFRKRKGLEFGPMQAEYEMHMQRLLSDARGVRTICFDGGSEHYQVMRVPVPDYIPSA